MTAGVFSFITEFTEQLSDWAGNWWFLGVIGLVAFLDSVLPIVPGETSVIIGGVAVSTGVAPYPLWAVIAVAAVAAFLGDNLAYSIGRHFSPRFQRRADRKPDFAVKLRWASDQLRQRGGRLLITARFIPGGRTVITLTSGITRQPRWWFVRWVAVAAVIWATYAAGLAYVVGKPFEDNHTAAFWVAFGTAMAVNVLIEVVRHLRQRRRKELSPSLAGVEAD